MPPKKLFIVISSTVTVAFIAIFLSLSPNLIGADTANNGAKDLSAKLSLPEGTVTLTAKKQDRGSSFKITRHLWLLQRSLGLTGFEEEVNLCTDHQIDFPLNTKSVCLAGEVGAHSMNLQIIQLTTTGLKAVSFSPATGSGSPNIASDLPFFSFKDINNDNILDLAVYNRDYDTDPLRYAFKSYYLGDREGSYHFDSTERIAYNINDN